MTMMQRAFATSAQAAAKTSTPAFVQQALDSKDAISAFLSKPTWTSSQLLQAKPITHADEGAASASKQPIASSALVAKLLKQSGLMPVAPGSHAESQILRDLEGQLVFVNHICEVDTEGIEPLVRLGDVKLKLSFDDISGEIESTKVEWNPTGLAKERDGPFYILKEGLRHE